MNSRKPLSFIQSVGHPELTFLLDVIFREPMAQVLQVLLEFASNFDHMLEVVVLKLFFLELRQLPSNCDSISNLSPVCGFFPELIDVIEYFFCGSLGSMFLDFTHLDTIDEVSPDFLSLDGT
jgi:hypothetical protein